MTCVSKEDSDQAGHPPSLIRVFAVRKNLGTHLAHSEDWSEWADSQADLSLRWAHRSFCWFCHGAAHFMSVIKATKSIIYHVQRTRAVSKSTRCMLLFRLVLFAEPCLNILRWLEKRLELYWTTGDVPGRCLVVTTFENNSVLSMAIHTNEFYMVLASGVGISKHPTL